MPVILNGQNMALVLIGEGQAWYKGEILSGKEALIQAGLKPCSLDAKEGLALTNGVQMTAGVLALAVDTGRRLARGADIIASITGQALRVIIDAAAALVSENKVLSHPASVDTVPTSADQEDHVSMSTIATRKARDIADNVSYVMAVEYLCACQVLEFVDKASLSLAAKAAYNLLRKTVPALVEDRPLSRDIEAARPLVASGELETAVQKEIGNLQ
ncbi:MAG TPA: aromatic amino acid lyase [Firmicutes bacterium]|nr:aromatic amino acid lyase [Bacillota bacterium]